MTDHRVIAVQLAMWRKEKRYSEAECAKVLGVSLKDYRKWAGGQPCPYPAMVETKIGVPVAPMVKPKAWT